MNQKQGTDGLEYDVLNAQLQKENAQLVAELKEALDKIQSLEDHLREYETL